MLIRSILVILLTTVLANPTRAADVYKTVDEHGNVTYSDSPPKDKPSEKITVREPNSLPPVQPRFYSGESTTTSEEEEKGVYNPRIISPENDHQMGPRQASLTITVETSRPLEKEHFFQLFVNGEAQGPTSQSANLTLSEVRRGRKQVIVSIVDSAGTVIASSNPVTIYVIRPNPKPIM